jgi:DNA polymerase-3 subunit delta
MYCYNEGVIITLTGENSFGLQRELRRIIDEFTTEHGDLAVERLDGEETEFAKIQEALTGLPFLSAKKLVLLRAPGKNKQFVEKFEQLLNDIPATTDLIIVESKPDKRLSYYKYLKAKTDLRDFPELDEAGLVRWLTARAKEQAGSISPADARYLVERVGLDQALVFNELDKLLLYDSNITKRTIDLLTEPAAAGTVFQLLEAAFAGRAKQALELYNEQRAQKVEPPQIIAMLSWQLNVLAVIKTAGDRPADQIAREARLNPFVVRKSQGIARNLSITELKRLVKDLLSIDTRSKRTGIDPDEALQHYLLKLSNI